MSQINYKKASAYYFVGNIFNKGIAFLTVPILTRILSTYDYGIVTTYNSWVIILAIILGLALHTGIRMAYVDYKENFDKYVSSNILFTIVSSLVVCVLALSTVYLFKIDISMWLVSFCLSQAIATALIQDYDYYLMMQYRYKLRTLVMIVPGLLSVIVSIFVIIFVLDDNLYLGRIAPTSIIHSAIALLVVVLFFIRHGISCKKEYIEYGLKLSTPLIVHGIALNILSQSDRIMITSLADASQTGIYSLIYNLSMIATVITASFDGVWVPWFLQKMKAKDIKSIEYVAEKFIYLMTTAMVGLIMVSPEIVKILADEEYWEGTKIVPPIIISSYVIFMYTLYVNIEHYYKKTIFITINTFIAAVTNLALNYYFIPQAGYVAAAYTTLVSYLISFALHYRYAKKLEPKLYPLSAFIIPFVIIGISCIIFYSFIDNWIVRFGILFVYIAGSAYLKKDELLKMISELKNRN